MAWRKISELHAVSSPPMRGSYGSTGGRDENSEHRDKNRRKRLVFEQIELGTFRRAKLLAVETLELLNVVGNVD